MHSVHAHTLFLFLSQTEIDLYLVSVCNSLLVVLSHTILTAHLFSHTRKNARGNFPNLPNILTVTQQQPSQKTPQLTRSLDRLKHMHNEDAREAQTFAD